MSGTYRLTVTKTPVTIPTIGGDLYPEDGSESGYMFSALQGSPYIVDLTFALYSVESGGEGEQLVQEAISSVSSSGPAGVSFAVQNTDPMAYVVRTTGTPASQFGGDTYDFVLRTDDDTKPFPTVQNVQAGGSYPDYLAVYRWDPATVSWISLDGAYEFTANPGSASEASNTLSQYVYWNWNSGISSFVSVVESGEI